MTTLVLKTKDAAKARQLFTGFSQNVEFQQGDYPSPSVILCRDDSELDIVEGLLSEEGVQFNRRST